MDEIQTASMFKALGDPTRLRIVSCLRSCCCPISLEEGGEVRPVDGQTAGEVCCLVTGADKITSTISFHLKELRQAGLIRMERRGKNMICSIDRDAIKSLSEYLGAAPGSCEGDCDCACGEDCCKSA